MCVQVLHKHALPLPSQDGVELQKDSTSLDDLWLTAMDAYRTSDWETVINRLEEAIHVFDSYQNHSLACLQQCYEKREEKEWWVGRERNREIHTWGV